MRPQGTARATRLIIEYKYSGANAPVKAKIIVRLVLFDYQRNSLQPLAGRKRVI
jgi:hypothetical protein